MDRLIALVTLRVRLELRALAGSRGRAIGLLLTLPALALGSLFTAAGLVALVGVLSRSDPRLLLSALSALATLVGAGFALSPLLVGIAAVETHDLTRLLSYPVRLPTLLAASLVANLLQPTVIAMLAPLVALALALAGPRWPLALLGLGLGLLLQVALAQAVGLALHAVSRNRRVHDRLLFAGIGLGVLLSLLPVLLLVRGAGPARRLLLALLERDVFALSPLAWGARAAVHAGRGEPWPFLGWSAATALALLAVVGVSAAIAHRLYRGELDVGEAGAARGEARVRLPGAWGAVLEKDVRVAWRDPRLKAISLSGVIGPLLLLLLLGQGTRAGVQPAHLALVALMAGLGVVGSNALALERDGLALLLGFPVDRLELLAGKNGAAIVMRAPVLITVALAAAFLAGPLLAAAAATVVLLTQLLASAADNYLQILVPLPVPAAGRDPSAPVSGSRGLGMAALGFLVMGLAFLAASPFAFLAWLPWLLSRSWLFLVSLPLALAGAAAVYFMLTSGAARLLERREPELLARLRGED